MPGWNFAAVWHGIAEIVPDREAVVCGERRVSWGELDDRAARLASHLWSEGLRPGDKVAIDCTNRPEYLETYFGALKLGCVPVNVNYRYVTDEVRYVLDNSDAKAIVHDPAFATTVQEAIAGLPADRRPSSLQTGNEYEQALDAASADGPWTARTPDGDDLSFLYTGGTTGMPKGVMWRNDDLYVSLWQLSRPGTEPPDPVAAAKAGKRTGISLPACPLMHGTGLHTALSTLAGASTVVLVDRVGLDAELLWSEIERNDVAVLTIVGDPFARPLLAALDAEPKRWDLSALRAITSSGATWSPETKAALLERLPQVRLFDSLGSSEGLMSRTVSSVTTEIAPARFAVNANVKVFDEQTSAEVAPGSGDVGFVGVTGPIPLGYYKDEEKTNATFRVIDGVRYSIPGDYATVDADGSIQLLGRGSACINTGGEKVYPEEVELVLREHPLVFDCVIIGVPDPRFGEKVVALVQPTPGHTVDITELQAWTTDRLAGYKRPKQVFLVDSLERSAAGKANYPRLRELAVRLATTTTT
ncbi:MAG: AMP-binding protein [Actinobacteria bacterium]|nr:AMP-binding protein [Actinomycetota bacterium]